MTTSTQENQVNGLTGNERQIIAQMGLHGESDLQAMAKNLLFDLERMKFPSYLLYTEALNSWEKLARDYSELKDQMFVLYSLPGIYIRNRD